ncbi:hypothetical protein D3C73_1256000 [compost metagenome]
MDRGGNILAHPEDAEGRDHVGNNNGLKAVDPLKLGHQHIVGQHAELLGHHQGSDDEYEQDALALKLIFSEGIACQRTEEECGQGDGHGDEKCIAD